MGDSEDVFLQLSDETRTSCRWVKAGRHWESIYVAIWWDHILPARGQRRKDGEHACVCVTLRWDHVLSASGQRRKDGEHVFVYPSDEITYFLQVGKGGEMVRKCLVAIWGDHIPSAGGQRQWDGEDVFVQLSNEITYELQAGKDKEMVKMCLCSYPVR